MAAGGSGQATAVTSPQRSRVTYDSYLLGPGDSLQFELLDIPELSGNFSIGPDVTIYLPRLRALYVKALTVEELHYFLTEEFKTDVKSPELYIRPVGYPPIHIYIRGEITRKQASTKLDFLSFIAEGDVSQNIRLFEGDVVSVGKSAVVLREKSSLPVT